MNRKRKLSDTKEHIPQKKRKTQLKQTKIVKRKRKPKPKFTVRKIILNPFDTKAKPLWIMERQAKDTMKSLCKEVIKLQKKQMKGTVKKEELFRIKKISEMFDLMKTNKSRGDTWVTPYTAWKHVISFLKSNCPETIKLSAIDPYFGEDFKVKIWCGNKTPAQFNFCIKQYIENCENLKKFGDSLRYNIVITNPPYSMIEECFDMCHELGKSFCLLVPVWVLQQDWFKTKYESTGLIVILRPHERYQYQTVRADGERNDSNQCNFDSVWI